MSKILDLAKSFKETSSKEAESISKALQHDLKQLENDLATALSKSNKSLKNAIYASNQALKEEISANQKRMSLSLFRTWLWAIALLAFLVLGLIGWSAWQAGTIVKQNTLIQEGREALEELPEHLVVIKDEGITYLIQDLEIKAKPEVYQSNQGNWVIRVGK